MTPVDVSIASMIEVIENHELKQNGKAFCFNGNESKQMAPVVLRKMGAGASSGQ